MAKGPGRPQGTTKTYPIRMEPGTYEKLRELATGTGMTIGATVQQLLTHGGSFVSTWASMSAGALAEDPKLELKAHGVLQDESVLRRTAIEIVAATSGGASDSQSDDDTQQKQWSTGTKKK